MRGRIQNSKSAGAGVPSLIGAALMCAILAGGTVQATPIMPAGNGPVVTDNCMLMDNSDQRDTDGDGYGNACDPDLNNDGAVNFVDLGIIKSRFFGSDPDADLNGDGAVNFLDLAVMRSMFYGSPGPYLISETESGPTPVPAPGTLALIAIGLLGMNRLRRRS